MLPLKGVIVYGNTIRTTLGLTIYCPLTRPLKAGTKVMIFFDYESNQPRRIMTEEEYENIRKEALWPSVKPNL